MADDRVTWTSTVLRIESGTRSAGDIAGLLGAPDAPCADDDPERDVYIVVPIPTSDGRPAEALMFVSGDCCVVEFPADGAESFAGQLADAKAFIADRQDVLAGLAAGQETDLYLAFSPADPRDCLRLDAELIRLLAAINAAVTVETFLDAPLD